ncbi:MAG TPA: TonB-dependent receptor [Pyrinomonadaceae bacterium]|nr:TonB-dependent receptor [Pyrinomonadaceae bacterium]
MNTSPHRPAPLRVTTEVLRVIFFSTLILLLAPAVLAQPAAKSMADPSLAGTVLDPNGSTVQNATIVIKDSSGQQVNTTTTDQHGHFSVTGLPPGKYSVEASAQGFALTTRTIQIAADKSEELSIPLQVADLVQAVVVEAVASDSIAAQAAPMDGLLDARSARTEVTAPFIQNYTAPQSDFSELVQMAPGTFSVNSNGVGLGDSKTFFRGFKDGQYDMTYDGIPFNDTNDPTHHSWVFFPSPWIGGVDFDRSPGSASTIGPTPFGGSINLLSKELAGRQAMRFGANFGSFNTRLYDLVYESGNFGFGQHKNSSLMLDLHHMSSDGYQTFNFQRRDGASLKYRYKFNDRISLTAFSGIISLKSNTPNAKGPTRQQVAQFGDNFLMVDDPKSPLYYKFYTYSVPTDFEYVDLNATLGHGWNIDEKPYTYRYNNAQFFNNGTSITATSATDKLNSYRKWGNIFSANQLSRFGILRVGFWYEWATTNRYQIPSDPRTRINAALPNFHESFITKSVQPFVEYSWHATTKLTITGGFKYSRYQQDLTQFPDNGKTVGNLNGAPFVFHSATYTRNLPSVDINYRLRRSWTIYGQYATGNAIPPSSVFDVKNANVTVLPQPTTAKTFQGGTVVKLRKMTFNADVYRTRFQNAYSASPDPSIPTATQYTASGDSVSKGFETEANINVTKGLNFYINTTVGKATFVTPGLPSTGLWVANTPSNTQAVGLSYKFRDWDMGFFHKRVGNMWQDNTATNGATINQVIPISPFNVTNAFVNFSLRKWEMFDQTRFRLSINNLFDHHDITSLTQVVKGPVYTPGPGDTLGLLPGRSFTFTVIFGVADKQ